MATTTLSKIVLSAIASVALSCGPSQGEIMRQTYVQDMNNPDYAPVRRKIALEYINSTLSDHDHCNVKGEADEHGFSCVLEGCFKDISSPPSTMCVDRVEEKSCSWSNLGLITFEGYGWIRFSCGSKPNLVNIGSEASKLIEAMEVYLGRR